MEDTRDLKTLLELLLEEVKSNLGFGLCACIGILWNKEIITEVENDIIFDFLKANRPKWYQYGYSFKQRSSAYWWKRGKVKPRVRFLKHWIKKLS